MLMSKQDHECCARGVAASINKNPEHDCRARKQPKRLSLIEQRLLCAARDAHTGSNACLFETHSSRHALHWEKDSLCIVACSHRIERAHARPTALQEVLMRLTAARVDV
eukprot:11496-Heterococcus_DN1.PRE.2